MDDQFIVVRGIGYGLYKTRILRADILFRDLFQCLKPTFSKKKSCHIMGQVFQILHHSMSLRKLDLRLPGWNCLQKE